MVLQRQIFLLCKVLRKYIMETCKEDAGWWKNWLRNNDKFWSVSCITVVNIVKQTKPQWSTCRILCAALLGSMNCGHIGHEACVLELVLEHYVQTVLCSAQIKAAEAPLPTSIWCQTIREASQCSLFWERPLRPDHYGVHQEQAGLLLSAKREDYQWIRLYNRTDFCSKRTNWIDAILLWKHACTRLEWKTWCTYTHCRGKALTRPCCERCSLARMQHLLWWCVSYKLVNQATGRGEERRSGLLSQSTAEMEYAG